LASVASVQTLTASDGTVNVTSGGVALVTGTTTPPASSYQVALHGTGPWYTQSVGLSIAGATYTPTSGAIAGNLAALHQIQAAGQQLATLSQQLAAAVPTGQSTAPTHVFTATANGALTVTAGVTPSTLQASAASTALTAIQTAESAWTQVVGGVGTAGQQATTEQANQQADLSALQTQQQSIQGVNLNQAAANTVQEQEAYQAATQLVQVQQSLVNSLLAAVS
jgi:flagellar hook-associated protein 1 FlgK